ncbi:pyridoxal-phosphate-dependent aminotransferase family protein [Photobacterium sp. 53610]|uniref:pyridoxal-phosphate-dependent aminotransferase family protein n=1 Tax=Photobacterium sp. 53610 TaxID=3102789 RepID=UPI003FA738DE
MNNADAHLPISFVPGPCPVHPDVLEYLAKPPFDHRTLEYGTLLDELTSMLQSMIGTCVADVYVLPSSGTQALEATMRNLVSPGHSVIVPINGHMGERLAHIADVVSSSVQRVRSPWTHCFDWERLQSKITKGSLVVAVHHETSTGYSNDIGRLGSICRDRDALLLVDTISSVGALPIRMDNTNVDAIVATSQKGVGSIAGLGIVAVGPRAWKRYNSIPKRPSFAWDWNVMRREFYRNPKRSPWTPAASLIRALHCSLTMYESRGGIASAAKRTADRTLMLRTGLAKLNFRILPIGDREDLGPVTVAYPPKLTHADDLIRMLLEDHCITISGGQGILRGKVIRVALFGELGYEAISRLLNSLDQIISPSSIS